MAGANKLIPEDLIRAIKTHEIDAVRAALAKDPGLISATTKGSRETLLHLAADYGSIEVVQLLLAAGADPNPVAALDFTPLDSARRTNDQELYDFLKSKGCKEYGEF